MSVSKISPIGSVDPPVGVVRPTDAAGGTSQQPSQQDRRPPAQPEPASRRFPWLSWETRQLEAASKQPSPYGLIPRLGETLDQKV
jgi:hypothetical protein